MKKSTGIVIGIIVVGMGWLTLSGHFDLGWLWALGLGGGYAAKKLVVDEAVDEMKQMIEKGQDLKKKHEEEVKRIEETDHTAGVSIADLVAAANERERERRKRGGSEFWPDKTL